MDDRVPVQFPVQDMYLGM